MTPLWVGIANFFMAQTLGKTSLKNASIGNPKVVLGAMSLISSGVWIYTLLSSEYPLATLFLPDKLAQSEFVEHMRRALQFDEICIFSSSFLWLTYQFWDLNSAGLMGSDWLVKAAILPVLTTVLGPGAAFAIGWYWKENALQSKASKK